MEGITQHEQVPGIQGGYKYQIQREGYNEIPREPAINLLQIKQMLDNYKTQYKLGEIDVKQKRTG